MDIRKFGAYISKLRKQHDLTQSQLAEMLNVTRQAVSKASTLDTIAAGFGKHGLDIRHIVDLAVYMNEAGLTDLLKKASMEELDEGMLEKFAPFLDRESKDILFTKIINGELNQSLLKVLMPYLDLTLYSSLIDAAILEGQLDAMILKRKKTPNYAEKGVDSRAYSLWKSE